MARRGALLCGRFTLSASGEELAAEFELPEPFELAPRYNIAPTQDVASVVQDADGARRLTSHRWGLVPFWAKDPSVGPRMINARSETVAEKPAFRDSLRERRCIVPADGFYEWSKGGASRGPHWIHPRQKQLLGMAGLWATWKSPEGVVIESCTLLTTAANSVLRPLHDRMPVILPRERYAQWLDPACREPSELLPLLRPCPDDWLDCRPVGPEVNDVRFDDASCLQPPAQTNLF